MGCGTSAPVREQQPQPRVVPRHQAQVALAVDGEQAPPMQARAPSTPRSQPPPGGHESRTAAPLHPRMGEVRGVVELFIDGGASSRAHSSEQAGLSRPPSHAHGGLAQSSSSQQVLRAASSSETRVQGMRPTFVASSRGAEALAWQLNAQLNFPAANGAMSAARRSTVGVGLRFKGEWMNFETILHEMPDELERSAACTLWNQASEGNCLVVADILPSFHVPQNVSVTSGDILMAINGNSVADMIVSRNILLNNAETRATLENTAKALLNNGEVGTSITVTMLAREGSAGSAQISQCDWAALAEQQDIDSLQLKVAIAKSEGNRDSERQWSRALGDAFKKAGDHEKAAFYHERSVVLESALASEGGGDADPSQSRPQPSESASNPVQHWRLFDVVLHREFTDNEAADAGVITETRAIQLLVQKIYCGQWKAGAQAFVSDLLLQGGGAQPQDQVSAEIILRGCNMHLLHACNQQTGNVWNCVFAHMTRGGMLCLDRKSIGFAICASLPTAYFDLDNVHHSVHEEVSLLSQRVVLVKVQGSTIFRQHFAALTASYWGFENEEVKKEGQADSGTKTMTLTIVLWAEDAQHAQSIIQAINICCFQAQDIERIVDDIERMHERRVSVALSEESDSDNDDIEHEGQDVEIQEPTKVVFLMSMKGKLSAVEITQETADQMRACILSEAFRSSIAMTLDTEPDLLKISTIDDKENRLLAVNVHIEVPVASTEAAEVMAGRSEEVAAAAAAGSEEAGIPTTVTATASVVQPQSSELGLFDAAIDEVKEKERYNEQKREMISGEMQRLVSAQLRQWIGQNEAGDSVSEDEFAAILDRVMASVVHGPRRNDAPESSEHAPAKANVESGEIENSAGDHDATSAAAREAPRVIDGNIDRAASAAAAVAAVIEAETMQHTAAGNRSQGQDSENLMRKMLEQEMRSMFVRVEVNPCKPDLHAGL